MGLTCWFLRRPGLFARAQPKSLLEEKLQDRSSSHSSASTLMIFFLTLDQRPTHTSASGIYSKSIWDSLVHAGSWAHLGALLVSSLTLLVLAQRLCLVMTVHLHILNCGYTVTLNLWVLIC